MGRLHYSATDSVVPQSFDWWSGGAAECSSQLTGSMLIDRVEGRRRSGRVTPGQHFAPGDGTVATLARKKRAAAGEAGTGMGVPIMRPLARRLLGLVGGS